MKRNGQIFAEERERELSHSLCSDDHCNNQSFERESKGGRHKWRERWKERDTIRERERERERGGEGERHK